MPFFSVLIEGSNQCIPGQGDEPPAVGFFTSRIVWARELRMAARKAVQAVRDDWRTGSCARQPTADQLKLVVSESSLSSVFRWVFGPNKGHVFFSADPEDGAVAARPADPFRP